MIAKTLFTKQHTKWKWWKVMDGEQGDMNVSHSVNHVIETIDWIYILSALSIEIFFDFPCISIFTYWKCDLIWTFFLSYHKYRRRSFLLLSKTFIGQFVKWKMATIETVMTTIDDDGDDFGWLHSYFVEFSENGYVEFVSFVTLDCIVLVH